jgi:hypothetical protein
VLKRGLTSVFSFEELRRACMVIGRPENAAALPMEAAIEAIAASK